MGGLENGVGKAGFDEVFFDVALAVVVHEFAEDGVEDGGVDEMGCVVAEGGVDHVVSGFVSLTMGVCGGLGDYRPHLCFSRMKAWAYVIDGCYTLHNSVAIVWLG